MRKSKISDLNQLQVVNNNFPTTDKLSMKLMMMREYLKCLKSPAYFIDNYCYVEHPKRGKVKFKLYPFQKDCLDDFEKHNWNIVLKSRQLGLSTLTANYVLWLLNFFPNKSSVIIANKASVAKKLIKKIKIAYDMIPNWLKTKLLVDNKQSLLFANGSWINALASSPDAARGDALSYLVFDLAAILKNNLALLMWTSAKATLATGGKCVAGNTKITVRNKKTGSILLLEIELFYNWISA